jgi:hypothetical protein
MSPSQAGGELPVWHGCRLAAIGSFDQKPEAS